MNREVTDNTTPHAASDYEQEIVRAVPFHADILALAIEVALAARPIRVSEHLDLLARAGFSVVELIWRSYAQAGFVCTKG